MPPESILVAVTGLTCSGRRTTSSQCPVLPTGQNVTRASSMMTTSKRVVRGSKFSTTRDSGMTQTGTAPRHSLIFRAASARSSATRTPWPLPMRRMVSEPANERLTLARRGAARLRRPCALVDEFNGGRCEAARGVFSLLTWRASSETTARRSSSS